MPHLSGMNVDQWIAAASIASAVVAAFTGQAARTARQFFHPAIADELGASAIAADC